ncbi:hypothetical protein HanPSC8_Chr06g0258451 [Helianthus annuus]|nr:hypothetical protein HanPSC8_Chr06g0258451 [Helianthus annuus]
MNEREFLLFIYHLLDLYSVLADFPHSPNNKNFAPLRGLTGVPVYLPSAVMPGFVPTETTTSC